VLGHELKPHHWEKEKKKKKTTKENPGKLPREKVYFSLTIRPILESSTWQVGEMDQISTLILIPGQTYITPKWLFVFFLSFSTGA
jgi:hypothetical protein